MIATRHLGVLALVCAVALMPVGIHSYVGLVVDDGFRTDVLPFDFGAFRGLPEQRKAWDEVFGSFDWTDRRYSSPDGDVALTVVRTYDMKRAYHHPELALAYGVALPTHDVRTVADIPLHVLRGPQGLQTAVYALHYGGRFVADPLRFHLLTAVEQLVGGRRPMTLVFARDLNRVGDRPFETWPSTVLVRRSSAALPR